MINSKQLSDADIAVLVDYFKLLIEIETEQRINRDE